MPCKRGDMDIEQRNRLRVEVGLPLLDVPTEMTRLKKRKVTRSLKIISS
jgi:hypothetical protein